MKPVKDFCQQIQKFMQPENSTSTTYELVPCTIQRSRYDCGMHVIMNAKEFIIIIYQSIWKVETEC